MTGGPQGADPSFTIRFWGTRGSLPCPGPETVRYGGNTTCIEVRCGGRVLIIDAGSGLRKLGQSLMRGGRVDADIFFTHTHWDHVCGLPFFVPAFIPGNAIRFHAAHLGPADSIHRVLAEQMLAPLFPVPLGTFGASCSFSDFPQGAVLNPLPGVTLRTGPLNHPNGATGYRIEYAGRVACVITDTEHPESGRDPNVMALVQDADVMVYDAMFADAAYPRFKGWGHSTWEEAIRIAEAANVKRPVLFHHDPNADDAALDAVAAAAAARYPGALVAKEGETLTL